MTRYLYVSRDWDGNWSLDDRIKALVEGEFCGAGVGCGTRDLDFLIDEEMTQEQVNDLRDQVAIICGPLEVSVLYQEWDEDGEIELRSIRA